MPRVLRAIDLREPPPQYELPNGTRLQIAYLDAPGWALWEAYQADLANVDALDALVRACVPDADMAELDRVCAAADFLNIIALAKGHAPEIVELRKNGRSDAGPPAPASPTPPSSPPTPLSTPSPASPAPTGGRSRKSGTSGTTPPSMRSAP